MENLEELVKQLTPEERQELQDFIEFLLWREEKRQQNSTAKENG